MEEARSSKRHRGNCSGYCNPLITKYHESLPPQQKQAIWSVIAGALRVFANTQDQKSDASLELYKALVSLSRGEQGDKAAAQALAPRRPRLAQRSAPEEYHAARCLAAFEHFPKRRKDIDNWSRKNLGRSLTQLLKQRDNLDQGRVKSPALSTRTELHESHARGRRSQPVRRHSWLLEGWLGRVFQVGASDRGSSGR